MSMFRFAPPIGNKSQFGSIWSFPLSPYVPKTRGERRIFWGILGITATILLLILVFYLLNPRDVFGDSLVNLPNSKPEELPPPSVFPYYMKPITILFAASVVFAYCFFALTEELIRTKLPRALRSFLLVISVLLFAMVIYEVVFNFTLWSSLMVSNPNPDLSVNIYPVNSVKVNLVYATKSFVALSFVIWFALATLRKSLESENTL